LTTYIFRGGGDIFREGARERKRNGRERERERLWEELKRCSETGEIEHLHTCIGHVPFRA
jgi:hypothetical protein